MNIPVRHATAATKLAIVDCDIHPAFRKPSDLYPFLPAQWREHMITFGEHLRQGVAVLQVDGRAQGGLQLPAVGLEHGGPAVLEELPDIAPEVPPGTFSDVRGRVAQDGFKDRLVLWVDD